MPAQDPCYIVAIHFYQVSHVSQHAPYQTDTAIVLCGFGSVVGFSHLQALQIQLQQRFALCRVELAITSRTILTRLAKRGEPVFSLAEAFAKLEREGIKHIVVANGFLFPTEEYSRALRVVEGFKQFSTCRFAVTDALLQRADSVHTVGRALMARFPADEGLVNLFLTHGTANLNHTGYQAIRYTEQFLEQGASNHLTCSLEGAFAFDAVSESLIHTIKTKLAGAAQPKVRLIPLLLVAGNHFLKDIAAIQSQLQAHATVELATPIVGDTFCMLDLPEIETLLFEHIHQQLGELE